MPGTNLVFPKIFIGKISELETLICFKDGFIHYFQPCDANQTVYSKARVQKDFFISRTKATANTLALF